MNTKSNFFERNNDELVDLDSMSTSSTPCIFVDGSDKLG